MSNMGKGVMEKLLSGMGGKYSRELGIDLTGNNPEDIFKWFLVAKLFGHFLCPATVTFNLSHSPFAGSIAGQRSCSIIGFAHYWRPRHFIHMTGTTGEI